MPSKNLQTLKELKKGLEKRTLKTWNCYELQDLEKLLPAINYAIQLAEERENFVKNREEARHMDEMIRRSRDSAYSFGGKRSKQSESEKCDCHDLVRSRTGFRCLNCNKEAFQDPQPEKIEGMSKSICDACDGKGYIEWKAQDDSEKVEELDPEGIYTRGYEITILNKCVRTINEMLDNQELIWREIKKINEKM